MIAYKCYVSKYMVILLKAISASGKDLVMIVKNEEIFLLLEATFHGK